LTNYWEPVEAQWRQNHGPALQRLLILTADTHQLFADVATAEAITHAPPSDQNTVERVLLRRLGEELRAVELLAEAGHGFQAATLTASLFEQCHFLTYISNNEAKPKEFRTWNNSRYSIGGSIKTLVEASGAIRSWSAERIAEEYKTYELLCGFKHNNPMFIRTILLPSDPDLYLAQLCLYEANWFLLTALGLFVALRFPFTACDTILGRCNLILDQIKENYPAFRCASKEPA
jgi:hypothetical protein